MNTKTYGYMMHTYIQFVMKYPRDKSFFSQPTDYIQIVNTIYNLKNKASSMDGIHAKIIKYHKPKYG